MDKIDIQHVAAVLVSNDLLVDGVLTLSGKKYQLDAIEDIEKIPELPLKRLLVYYSNITEIKSIDMYMFVRGICYASDLGQSHITVPPALISAPVLGVSKGCDKLGVTSYYLRYQHARAFVYRVGTRFFYDSNADSELESVYLSFKNSSGLSPGAFICGTFLNSEDRFYTAYLIVLAAGGTYILNEDNLYGIPDIAITATSDYKLSCSFLGEPEDSTRKFFISKGSHNYMRDAICYFICEQYLKLKTLHSDDFTDLFKLVQHIWNNNHNCTLDEINYPHCVRHYTCGNEFVDFMDIRDLRAMLIIVHYGEQTRWFSVSLDKLFNLCLADKEYISEIVRVLNNLDIPNEPREDAKTCLLKNLQLALPEHVNLEEVVDLLTTSLTEEQISAVTESIVEGMSTQ